MGAKLSLTALPGIPLIRPGDDLGALVIDALATAGLQPCAHDIVVVAQKIVSKAEGCYVDLAQVAPGARAQELAGLVDKDARLVQVILDEATAVIRYRPGVLVVAHRLGFVMANAGIDRSNIEPGEQVLLLPKNPDASCAGLKAKLEAHFRVELAVIINDSVGRAWRNGTIGTALGAAGLPALHDLRGEKDLYGRELQVTQVGLADEVAAAASLLMGQAAEGLPVVLVRGLAWSAPASTAAALIRAPDQDLFR